MCLPNKSDEIGARQGGNHSQVGHLARISNAVWRRFSSSFVPVFAGQYTRHPIAGLPSRLALLLLLILLCHKYSEPRQFITMVPSPRVGEGQGEGANGSPSPQPSPIKGKGACL